MPVVKNHLCKKDEMAEYYVYILANPMGTLYVGMTSNLEERVRQHKNHDGSKFTSKYTIGLLVYYEEFRYVNDAIAREKQIKGLRREKKNALIESTNPKWEDLSKDWFG